MFQNITPAVKILLFLNIAVFILLGLNNDKVLEMTYFALYKSNALGFRAIGFEDYFKPVQIFTYFFNHGSLMHIFFNMYALVSFGSHVERVMGTPRFFKFYIFSGAFAGILLAFLDPSPNPVVGASGAICGILLLFAIFYPKAQMGLFLLPIYFDASKIVLGIAVVSTILILYNGSAGGISHFGHLAGMVSALILYEFENITNRFRK